MVIVVVHPDVSILRSIAAHEAGHCVAAVKLGMLVRKIEIIATPDGLDGYSHVDHEHSRLIDYVAMILSGAAAESNVMGFKAASRPHSNSDDQRISEAIAKVGHSQRALLMAMATQKAQRLVRTHRPTVLTLAGALFERCVRTGQNWDALEVTLTSDELIELLGGDETALLLRRAV